MLILLLIFSLISTFQAVPLTPDLIDIQPLVAELNPRFTTSLYRRTFVFGERSVTNIVLSCLATIFACTWTAIHPNIPGPTDSGWTNFKRRGVTTVYALLAPEMIVYWAMKQKLVAISIAERYNMEVAKVNRAPRIWFAKAIWRGIAQWFTTPDLPPRIKKGQAAQWTIAHGFFLQMGGFMLCDEGQPIQVLDYNRLSIMIETKEIEPPRTTKEEIQDRNKGDTISKTVVILQTTWFIVQCVMRWSARLPVTKLEVVTLGFALLNGITYALWWNKPQSVGVPVYLERRDSFTGVASGNSHEAAESQFLYDSNDTSGRHAAPSDKNWLSIKLYEYYRFDNPIQFVKFWTFDILILLVQTLLRPFYKMLNDDGIVDYALRVPMFFTDDTIDKGSNDFIIAFGSSLIGVLFGFVHLLPSWFLDWPSLTEMWLWRGAAIIITGEPVIIALRVFPEVIGIKLPEVLEQLIYIPLLLGLPLYIISRFILIVLAFTSLRALPATALLTIDWVSSIPHF